MRLSISRQARRRFLLGCQGLWPGRRAGGLDGTRRALHLAECVQVDPLSVVARSHDLVLHSRVLDYRPEYLDSLLYELREFFDYGGVVRIRPMWELPYARLEMAAVRGSKRWSSYEGSHGPVLTYVRDRLRLDGPLAARDLPGSGGAGTKTFRSAKETSIALYYLWLTGEVMTHGRRNFDRLYALSTDVVPPQYDRTAGVAEAEEFFTAKAGRWAGIADAATWATRLLHRRVVGAERAALLEDLVAAGVLTPVDVEGERATHYVSSERLPWLEQVQDGGVPDAWRPVGPDTTCEAVLLSPFDVVTRVRRSMFDFEFLFEAYKPAAKRRWGYYTMPVLYGDRLVARLDPKLDRDAKALRINGLWLENDATARDENFLDALARGLVDMAVFAGAALVEVSAIEPVRVRARLRASTRWF